MGNDCAIPIVTADVWYDHLEEVVRDSKARLDRQWKYTFPQEFEKALYAPGLFCKRIIDLDLGMKPVSPYAQPDVLACRDCTRLVKHQARIKRQHPDYWCAPVPGCCWPTVRVKVDDLGAFRDQG